MVSWHRDTTATFDPKDILHHPTVFEHAFDSAPVPAILFDGTRVAAANEAARTLMGRAEISATCLRELQGLISRHNREGQPGMIGSETMRFLVFLPTPLGSDGHLRISFLVPTCRETPADVYARRGLTRPEKRVADFLLLGMTNRAIAASLGRSKETIHTHVSKILRKCEVPNRSAFVALALSGSPNADCRGILKSYSYRPESRVSACRSSAT